MLRVNVKDPENGSKELSFEQPSLMIGRATGNDICIDVRGASRYHARLSVEGEIVFVEDLDSTNGTFVNSEKVSKVQVSPSDEIQIGEAVIVVERQSEEEEEGVSGLEEVEGTQVGAKAVQAQEVKPKKEAKIKPEKKLEEKPAKKPVKKEPTVDVEVAPESPAPSEDVGEGDMPEDFSSEQKFYWKSLEKFFGPLWQFVLDEDVSEIMINGHEEIFIEKKGKLAEVDVPLSNEQLKAAVLNIAQYVGRRVTEEEPYMDARLPDGSRVAVLLPPCSRKGISVSIRKFAKEGLTMDKLLGFGSLSKEMVTFLEAAVVLKKNIMVSGGTSSGKTSLLNVVSGLIPSDERILTIEDSAELQLSQDHVLPMETKAPDKKGRGQVTIRDLVKASLRMRPDRIVVGEIRGGEALDLLQAMNTGHSGSMATVHASSPPQALTRLETLSLFSGVEIPMRALREQVSTAVDMVIQAARLPDHSRKVTHISEVGRLDDSGSYVMHDIFKFKSEGMNSDGKIDGKHVKTGNVPSFIEEIELAGMTDALALFK